jgi:AcrR family transcriptional regulator
VRAHAQSGEEAQRLIDAAPARGKKDKAHRQQALIEAANTVFAEHGYDCATTREIARRAGCAEGLIHRYFHGKQGLLLAILQGKSAQVVADFRQALPDHTTVREELRQIFDWYLKVMWERRDYMRVSISRATIDPEVGHTISHRINDIHVQLIAGKLRVHQDAGRIRPAADLRATAYSISALGFAIGFIFQSCFGEDRDLARHILMTAAGNITRGLAPATPATPR